MHLEILVPAHTSSDDDTVHYRRAGDQHPLCSQSQSNWRIIKLRDRMANYAKYKICMECGERKRQLELSTIG